MTRILHIETATRICSVCLSEGDQVIGTKESHEPNSHSRVLTIFIEDILKENGLKACELDALSVSLGPGSYTGLRIGASTVKGLAYGCNLPVIGLDTLSILAQRVLHEEGRMPSSFQGKAVRLRPMIDARRMEVYSSAFDQNLSVLDPVKALVVDEMTFVQEFNPHPFLFFGDGAEKCLPLIDHPNAFFIGGVESSSVYMIDLALASFRKKDFLNTAYFEPFYLKDFIATLPKNKMFPQQP